MSREEKKTDTSIQKPKTWWSRFVNRLGKARAEAPMTGCRT